RAFGRAPAEQRAQASKELAERERLRQVVVGANVQSSNPVIDRFAGREHEDGGPSASSAQSITDGEAVQAREQDVEEERVVIGFHREVQALLTVRGKVNRVALLLDPSPDCPR